MKKSATGSIIYITLLSALDRNNTCHIRGCQAPLMPHSGGPKRVGWTGIVSGWVAHNTLGDMLFIFGGPGPSRPPECGY
jgi:hypothetical protein